MGCYYHINLGSLPDFWTINSISYIGVSKNRGTPKWMVKIMENPIKHGMILGYPYFRKHPHICQHCFYQHVVSPPATRRQPTTRPRPPRSSTFRSLDSARLDAGATRGAWQHLSGEVKTNGVFWGRLENHGMANYPPQMLQDFGTIKQYELRLYSAVSEPCRSHEIQSLNLYFSYKMWNPPQSWKGISHWLNKTWQGRRPGLVDGSF